MVRVGGALIMTYAWALGTRHFLDCSNQKLAPETIEIADVDEVEIRYSMLVELGWCVSDTGEVL